MSVTTNIITATALSLCVVAEIISPRTHYRLRDRLPGAFFIILLPICATLMAVPLSALWRNTFDIGPIIDLSALPTPLLLLVLLLFRYFMNYWQHRIEHWFLWPAHAVHHVQTDLHAANGYAHPLQLFSEFLFISVPLSLIDTNGIALPLAVNLIVATQAMIIHSPLRVHMGPLRRILNDSRFHRIHHSRETRHFDRNFATVFTLWDQLFGTAYFPAKDEWPDVGVDGLANPKTPMAILLYPVHMLTRSTDRDDQTAGPPAIILTPETVQTAEPQVTAAA